MPTKKYGVRAAFYLWYPFSSQIVRNLGDKKVYIKKALLIYTENSSSNQCTVFPVERL
jgi:hypothetical protein